MGCYYRVRTLLPTFRLVIPRSSLEREGQIPKFLPQPGCTWLYFDFGTTIPDPHPGRVVFPRVCPIPSTLIGTLVCRSPSTTVLQLPQRKKVQERVIQDLQEVLGVSKGLRIFFITSKGKLVVYIANLKMKRSYIGTLYNRILKRVYYYELYKSCTRQRRGFWTWKTQMIRTYKQVVLRDCLHFQTRSVE